MMQSIRRSRNLNCLVFFSLPNETSTFWVHFWNAKSESNSCCFANRQRAVRRWLDQAVAAAACPGPRVILRFGGVEVKTDNTLHSVPLQVRQALENYNKSHHMLCIFKRTKSIRNIVICSSHDSLISLSPGITAKFSKATNEVCDESPSLPCHIANLTRWNLRVHRISFWW